MRLLTTICVAVIAVAFCMPAFAETQNVKISGDIGVNFICQGSLDLSKDDDSTAGGATTSDSDEFFTQAVGLNVDADLTDNVTTFIRVISERDWDASAAAQMDVHLDEAYVVLKEFLYAPLTLKLGRQDMWFGRGLIIGANALSWDAGGTLTPHELSETNSFDAIRGTLDYDPWTIDLVYSKIDANTMGNSDDIDLYGVNVGYLFDRYEAEAEVYCWYEHDQSTKPTAGIEETLTILCLGLRGSFVPYENMNVWAEGATQLGDYEDANLGGADGIRDDREGFALDIGIDYQWVETIWTPKAGLEYIFFSGDASSSTTSGDFEGWDPMYKGKSDSIIREYMDVLYNTDYIAASGMVPAADERNRLDGNTNQNQIKGTLVVEPMADVTLDGALSYFWLDKSIVDSNSSDEIGYELDGGLAYDYTEDVSFNVKGGVFWPGEVYPSGIDDRATKVISSVKVEF